MIQLIQKVAVTVPTIIVPKPEVRRMKYQKLGNSDLNVSLCCLGTMTFGEQCSERQAFELLDAAVSRGVNFIDTAESYPAPHRAETAGTTERAIGRWLAARPGMRERVVLATKVAGGPIPGRDRSYVVANRYEPALPNPPQPDLTPDNIRAAIEASLRRLRTPYIDLYQLHWPARYVPTFGRRQYRPELERSNAPSYEDQVRMIGELIREGKIRHWGLSNETTYGVCQFVMAAKRLGVPPPVSIQNDFSLVYRCFEEELAEACAPSNYNIGLLCYGVLAGGALTGKYLGGKAPEGARHTKWAEWQPRYTWEPTQAATAAYAALAEHKGLSPAALAIAWAKSRWYTGSVIIGATSIARLHQNINAFDVELDDDTLEAIDMIHLNHRNPNATD